MKKQTPQTEVVPWGCPFGYTGKPVAEVGSCVGFIPRPHLVCRVCVADINPFVGRVVGKVENTQVIPIGIGVRPTT